MPVHRNGDGTITISARGATWGALLLVLLSGGTGGAVLLGDRDLGKRVQALETEYSQLGGPGDPMNGRVAKLEAQMQEIRDSLAAIRADIRVIRYRLDRQAGDLIIPRGRVDQ